MKYAKSNKPCIEFLITYEGECPEGYTEITEGEYEAYREQNIESNGWYQITEEERQRKDVLFNRMWYKLQGDKLDGIIDFDRPLIEWNGEPITCDRASELMLFYLGDEEDTYEQLETLKKAAKDYIRSLFKE